MGVVVFCVRFCGLLVVGCSVGLYWLVGGSFVLIGCLVCGVVF